jgi:thiol-disulfide isomerase/thioredoxin
MIKKWLTKSNIINIVFFLVMIVLIFSTDAKGIVIQGLMKIGLFQPKIAEESNSTATNNISNKAKTGVLFKNEDGKVYDLADFKGKVVFINFWATWCPPCIAEMPSINNMQKKFKDNKDVVILMVDADNQIEKSQKFMIKHQYDLKVFTPASQIPATLLGGALPTTVLLNKNGEIVFRHEGAADYENKDFQDYIEKLVKE